MLINSSLRLLLLGASLSLLTACSWFSDDEETPDARVLAPLEIPPDLVTPVGDPLLARPELPAVTATAAAPAAAQPPSIGERVLPAGKGVQRMREGQRRWLLVEVEPEQAWPLVQKFLTMRGYRIHRDEPAIGLLETDWKLRHADEKTEGESNWRELLRLRIEPAERAGRTDIYLNQLNSQRVDGEWQLRPADNDRAVEMLNRLAQYLSAENVTDAAPLAGLEASIGQDDSDHTAIIVKADFDKVWRRTHLALESLGFVIEDHNQASQVFHVYNELPSGYTEAELQEDSRKKATVREEYWVRVQSIGEQSYVSIRTRDGQADESTVARHLLTLLLGQLK